MTYFLPIIKRKESLYYENNALHFEASEHPHQILWLN